MKSRRLKSINVAYIGEDVTVEDIEKIPLIKEYMDIGVKNDEQLVKLAGVLQRLLASSNSTTVAKEKINTSKKDTNDDFFGLSDDEKNQIMKDIKEISTTVK